MSVDSLGQMDSSYRSPSSVYVYMPSTDNQDTPVSPVSGFTQNVCSSPRLTLTFVVQELSSPALSCPLTSAARVGSASEAMASIANVDMQFFMFKLPEVV